MKKFIIRLFSVSLFFIFFYSTARARIDISQEGNKQIIKISLEGIDFKKVQIFDREYQKIVLRGTEGYEGLRYKVGQPELPVIRFFVDNAVQIDLDLGNESTLEPTASAMQIAPVLEPMVKLPDVVPTVIIDDTVYGTNEFIPDKPYDIETIGSVQGMKRQLVTLYPVQINPVTGQKKIINEFKIVSTILPKQNISGDILVFLIGEKFGRSPSIDKYADHKTKLGFTVRKLVIDTASKTPEKIRKMLQNIYSQEGPRFRNAIIFGDNEDIPGGSSQIISGVTDHYYKAIDKDPYDSDIGSPDIHLGRVSAIDEDQLAVIINKFIRYEKSAIPDLDWLKKISFVATDDKVHHDIAEDTHNYAIDTYTKLKGYTGDFPAANEPGGDKLYAITNNASDQKVQETLRLGRTIINYSGHGESVCWQGPWICKEDLDKVVSDTAMPFVIANACSTGRFIVDECIGEAWIRHPKGAIMYWGSMTVTYWTEDDILERKMHDGIFKFNKKSFGEITDYALEEVWKYYGGEGQSKYYYETYVTFGDPTIKLKLGIAE